MSESGLTRRITRGRGHVYELDGRGVPGVTKVLGEGFPKPALINWAATATAGAAVDRWDELAAMTPSERLRVLERARFQVSGEASVRGQDVHDLVDRLARGEGVEPSEELAPYVDSYLAWVEEWKPREILSEAVVVNRSARYMGTLDVIADLVDGKRWLLDWKTGAKGPFPEVGLQLAAYRYAETFVDVDGREQTLPQVDACGVLWLRSDGCDLLPVRAELAEFRCFQYAQALARFREQPREAVIGDALVPPAGVSA